MRARALSFGSKRDISGFPVDRNVQPYLVRNTVNSFSASDKHMGFHLKDLYDHFEINLDEFKVSIIDLVTASSLLPVQG